MKHVKNQRYPIERITREPDHYFFGYYDLNPWSRNGQYHLCHRVKFMNRMPVGQDLAELGMIRLHDCQYIPLAETYAWNFQQGAMLQWHPKKPDEEIIFNARMGGEFKGIIKNIITGEERILSRPVANIAPAGRYAISINFSRLFDFRPGYGYAGIEDPFKEEKFPENDGIFLVELESGESKLLISLRQLYQYFGSPETYKDHKFLINHLTFNTDGTRFVFLVRHFPVNLKINRLAPKVSWRTVLLTANTDGSDMYCLRDFGIVSHYFWRDPEQIVIYADMKNPDQAELYLLKDRSAQAEVIDKTFFTSDGHCSYSPDKNFILYDSYPDSEGYRNLLLYDLSKRNGINLAALHSGFLNRIDSVDIRCDLHPRWNRSGQVISFDSVHEGHRHIYLMEINRK